MIATGKKAGSGPSLSTSLRFPLANWVWGIFLFGSLVLLIPFILLAWLPQVHIESSVVLAFLSVAYSGFRLSVLALDGRKKLLNLTFWIFAYIWMGIAPLLQLATGDFPLPGTYSKDTLVYAAFIVLIGYVAYDLGSWLGNSYSFRPASHIVPLGLSLSKRRIYLLALLSIAISLFAAFVLGGFQVAIFSYRSTVSGEALSEFGSAGGVILLSLLRAPPFIASLLVLWAWLNRKKLNIRGRERVLLGALIPVLLTFTLMVANPVNAPRYLFGAVILSLAFLFLKWNRRHSMGLWIVALVVALMIVFPYADLFRRESSALVLAPVADQLISSGNYDAFQQLANTLELVSANGITFGWQLLGVLAFWIPSAVWPGKPIATGPLVADYSGYSFTNVSAPLWAEAHINLGIVGIILAFFAYGAITSLLQQKYLPSGRYSLSLISILVPLLAAYQIYPLRGALIPAFAYLVPLVGYLLLAAQRRQYSKPYNKFWWRRR